MFTKSYVCATNLGKHKYFALTFHVVCILNRTAWAVRRRQQAKLTKSFQIKTISFVYLKGSVSRVFFRNWEYYVAVDRIRRAPSSPFFSRNSTFLSSYFFRI